MSIVAIGEILWDVFADKERLGGAPFNFAAHSVRLGHAVDLVSAVGDDPRGCRAREEAIRLGVGVEFLETVGGAPTGAVSVRLSGGEPDYTILRPAAYDAARPAEAELAALAARRPAWLYFGTLFAHNPMARRSLEALVEALPGARRFYDVNLRPESWTPSLVDELLDRADVVKMNEDEARRLADVFGWPAGSLETLAGALAAGRNLAAVCITRGAAGCCLSIGGRWLEVPAVRVRVADAVGAGDAFSAALVHGLAEGWAPERVGEFANRVGALVASRRGAVPAWTVEEAWALEPAA